MQVQKEKNTVKNVNIAFNVLGFIVDYMTLMNTYIAEDTFK